MTTVDPASVLTSADEDALEVARAEEERRRRTTTTIRDGRQVKPEYPLTVDDLVAWHRRKLIAMRAVNSDPAVPYQPGRTPCALTGSIPGLLAAMDPDDALQHLLNLYVASTFPGRDVEMPTEIVRFTRRIRWKGRGFLYAEKGDYGLLLPRRGDAYERNVFHMRGAGGFSTMGDAHPTQIEAALARAATKNEVN